MAAKKARKRAYIPPSSEVVNRREHAEKTTTRHTTASRSQRSGGAGASRTHAYPQPSIGRTLRRLPIYFVMIFVLQYLLGSEGTKDADTQQRLILAAASAAFVTILFAPFMHVMDRFAYNRHLKRTGQQPTPPQAKANSRDADTDASAAEVDPDVTD